MLWRSEVTGNPGEAAPANSPSELEKDCMRTLTSWDDLKHNVEQVGAPEYPRGIIGSPM